MEHTKGELHRHALDIDIQKADGDHTRLVKMCESSTAYLPVYETQAANADRLVMCWNAHDRLQAKADCLDELVEACKDVLEDAEIYSVEPPYWKKVQQAFAKAKGGPE